MNSCKSFFLIELIGRISKSCKTRLPNLHKKANFDKFQFAKFALNAQSNLYEFMNWENYANFANRANSKAKTVYA